jgi:hypothetical protein
VVSDTLTKSVRTGASWLLLVLGLCAVAAPFYMAYRAHVSEEAAGITKAREVFPDATNIRLLNRHLNNGLPGAPYAVYFGNTYKPVVCDATGCTDLEICR